MGTEELFSVQLEPGELVALHLTQAHRALLSERPTERSEHARRYAIAITELEKLIAYFDYWVVRADYLES